MWPHRTSASGPPTPVFSENIVVPLHTYICKIDLKPKLGPDDHSPEQNGIAKELKKKKRNKNILPILRKHLPSHRHIHQL